MKICVHKKTKPADHDTILHVQFNTIHMYEYRLTKIVHLYHDQDGTVTVNKSQTMVLSFALWSDNGSLHFHPKQITINGCNADNDKWV
jgi:hypothetical protein